MRGFAIVDHQPGNDVVALWATSQTSPTTASHVNAVVLDCSLDPDAADAICSLTRRRYVLLTSGSVCEDFGVEGMTLGEVDVALLAAATADLQSRIVESARASRRKIPALPGVPPIERFNLQADSPRERALQLATYLAQTWTAWLETEADRRRRAEAGRVPPDLDGTDFQTLPRQLSGRLQLQPLI